MQVLGPSEQLAALGRAHAVGIGIFDGVHRGHQALLGEVVRRARADGIASLAYTFDPHPAQLFTPERAPKLIEPVETRLARIAALGIDVALVERFDSRFAEVEAEAFVRQVLHDKLGARHVVVGTDFAFGRGRRGSVGLLAQLGAQLGFSVLPMPLVEHQGRAVSSSAVRTAVSAGDVAAAAGLLGRTYSITGVAQRGAQRGTALGFPTANLHPTVELIPATGVYACKCRGPFGERLAVANLGFAPTFEVRTLRLEVHLLDFVSAPLYGAALEVFFVERLRGEQRFDGPAAIRAQLALDVAAAREVLARA